MLFSVSRISGSGSPSYFWELSKNFLGKIFLLLSSNGSVPLTGSSPSETPASSSKGARPSDLNLLPEQALRSADLSTQEKSSPRRTASQKKSSPRTASQEKSSPRTASQDKSSQRTASQGKSSPKTASQKSASKAGTPPKPGTKERNKGTVAVCLTFLHGTVSSEFFLTCWQYWYLCEDAVFLLPKALVLCAQSAMYWYNHSYLVGGFKKNLRVRDTLAYQEKSKGRPCLKRLWNRWLALSLLLLSKKELVPILVYLFYKEWDTAVGKKWLAKRAGLLLGRFRFNLRNPSLSNREKDKRKDPS